MNNVKTRNPLDNENFNSFEISCTFFKPNMNVNRRSHTLGYALDYFCEYTSVQCRQLLHELMWSFRSCSFTIPFWFSDTFAIHYHI